MATKQTERPRVNAIGKRATIVERAGIPQGYGKARGPELERGGAPRSVISVWGGGTRLVPGSFVVRPYHIGEISRQRGL